MHGNSALPLGIIYGIAEDYHVLLQGSRPLKGMVARGSVRSGKLTSASDLGREQPVRQLVLDLIGQQIIPCPAGTLCVPSRPHECIVWDGSAASTGTLKVTVDRRVSIVPYGVYRIFTYDGGRQVSQVVESAFCNCATFADADTLVTGSTDNMVRLWRVTRNDRSREQPLSITLTHIMRGHTATVSCVTASRAWSLIVTGSQDGSAALWDLNRGVYVRSIWHGSGPAAEVHLAAVNASTVCISQLSWRSDIDCA